jgi:hypothetical protein
MRVGRPRVTTVTGLPKQLSGNHAHAGLDPVGDLREMRAVVAHAVVADDCYRQPATGRAIVDLRILAILPAHKVHHAVGHRDTRAPQRAENIGRWIVVVETPVADLALTAHRKDIYR